VFQTRVAEKHVTYFISNTTLLYVSFGVNSTTEKSVPELLRYALISIFV
jgi:hypothetical protein